MKKLLPLFCLIALLAAGCDTDEPDAPRLFPGMSREKLKTRFGEPIRIVQLPGGGEDWFYTFSTPFQVETSSETDLQSRSVSAGVSISDNPGTEQRPVHLSPDGIVVEPIPRGHIVR